jgi:hypothetical protein
MASRIATRKSWFVFLSIPVLALSLSGQPAPSPTQGRRHAAAPADGIQTLYNVLASVSSGEEKTLFRGFSPSVKAALWSYHLSLFLAAHPELSEQQRAVIAEARQQIASIHFFEIVPASPEWPSKRASLEALTIKANATFTPALVREAFLKLGTGASALRTDERSVTSIVAPHAETTYPCECHSATWDCSGWNSSCIYGGDFCFERIGCGFWHEDSCDGMCV